MEVRCDKCGLGERELGRKEVIEWVNENIEMTQRRIEQWEKQCKEWGM
jgi:hypothetical protein